MLLAIDPGNDTGWSLFDDACRLSSCGLGDPPDTIVPYEVLIECPMLRPRGEKNPNAILKLARSAGEWAGKYDHVTIVRYLTPNDWKGSTPKAVSHRRILKALEKDELTALEVGCDGLSPRLSDVYTAIRKGLSKADRRHNVLDAIGIGLHGVCR